MWNKDFDYGIPVILNNDQDCQIPVVSPIGKGPKGDKGDTGEQGPKGDKGDVAACFRTIATSFDIEATSTATVDEFTIPASYAFNSDTDELFLDINGLAILPHLDYVIGSPDDFGRVKITLVESLSHNATIGVRILRSITASKELGSYISIATETENGLMSAEDKQTLEKLKSLLTSTD